MPTFPATHHSTRIDPGTPALKGGPSAPSDRGSLLTSGFGAVMEQEHDLQAATELYLNALTGRNSSAIGETLRNHQVRLEANINLLEQRYQMLPHPSRFRALREVPVQLAGERSGASPQTMGLLPNLLAQHRNLLREIEALVVQRSDGQRGRLILAQVALNHEEMAEMLARLIREDETAHDATPVPTIAMQAPRTAEEAWENDGGAPPRPRPPASGAGDRVA